MKRYIYIEALTMEEKSIEAGGVQVTTNGELVFLTTGGDIVAAVAPGFWSRFWQEGELVKKVRPSPSDGGELVQKANVSQSGDG